MRIGMHLQSLRPGRIGGLEGYVRRLAEHLPALDRDVTLVLFCADYNARTFAPGPQVEVHELSATGFATLDADVLRRHRLDVWFCPLLVLEPHEPGLPAAVTIPDLQHHAFPHFFPPPVLAWRHEHYPRSARRADAVITLSRFSRAQIVEAFGVPAARVHAIHLDADPGFLPDPARDAAHRADLCRRYGLPDRFVYYPANNWPHKNHQILFKALRSNGHQAPSVDLVLTGAEVDGAPSWRQMLNASGLNGRVRYLGYLPREDVAGLYGLARALVFPSLFEGFGMPVVEAMRAGCPVICSTACGLPEVAGEAALYFDPTRADVLAARIEQVVAGAAGPLIDAGRQQADRFSWARTARATLDVFRDIVRSSRPVVATAPDLPLISIVIPSLQQGRFIERTLASVLEQRYPRLEIIVMDGGSTDGTVGILERYRQQHPGVLRYRSEPDAGQADAVNRGLALARGDIIGWLNSDDTFAPGSLAAVSECFSRHPGVDVLYGRAEHISESDEALGPYPTLAEFHWETLAHQCFICQPTVFWRRRVTDEGLRLDDSLDLCLDYDFWIRLGRRYRFHFVDRHLANSRIYADNKTMSRRARTFEEAFTVVRRHYGRVPLSWALGRAHFERAQEVSVLDPGPVRPLTYLRAAALLIWHNAAARRAWAPTLRELRHLARQAARRQRDRLWRPASRTWKVPPGWLVVEVGLDVTTAPGAAGQAVEIACDGQVVDRLRVPGPGRVTRAISLLHRTDGRPRRLTMQSPLLATHAAEPLEPRYVRVAAEDGWLERHDRLLIPPGWPGVELTFAVPAAAGPGEAVLTFRHRGVLVDRWVLPGPGRYRRRLDLPHEARLDGSGAALDFASTAALPPQPDAGDPRELAIRIEAIVEAPAGTGDLLPT